jgi:hypothetical protein
MEAAVARQLIGVRRRIQASAGRAATLAIVLLSCPRATNALTVAERAALAHAFAPTLVFHPHERFFPVSPTAELGVWAPAERVQAYEALPLESRLGAAVVYYRVVEADDWLAPGQVRVEYWLYYAANRFSMRGGLVPFKGDGNHPHDLEHLFLVLDEHRRAARTPEDFRLREVWASAHAGSSIPSNRYRWSGSGVPPGERLDVLVELGSHAMAPDVNGDGRFTVDEDASGDRTFVWGVRDHGQSWARYQPAYADERPRSHAVRLVPADAGDERCADDERCATYALRPAEALDVEAEPMATVLEEARAAHARRHPLVSLFREVDGRVLLSPALHPDGRRARLIVDRPARAERGLAVGFTPVLSPATVFVSGRYAANLGTAHAPKVLINATALLLPGRTIGEVDLSVWYPIDAITKVLAGAQARTDLFTWEPTRRSLHAGVEFRVARWRWRLLARNGRGQSRAEFKMYYFVW